MTAITQTLKPEPALFIGIDWADQEHEGYVIQADGKGVRTSFRQTPEAIDEWLAEMRTLADGKPIAIILEQARGALIHCLMHRDNVILYPINPKQFARYRESFSGGDGKNDPTDAKYLARMLVERIDTLHPWLPDDEKTRLLSQLCEQRRKVVESQTQLQQQLISLLKQYFPLVLELFGKKHQLPLLLAILQRWSNPKKLRRADRQLVGKVLAEHGISNEEKRNDLCEQIRTAKLLTNQDALIIPLAMRVELLVSQIQQTRKTITQFDKEIEEVFRSHEDQHLFSSLRGAGPVLAPRLLAVFGSQRDRWVDADQIAAFIGIAPVTRQSGKQRIVKRRFACPKYLRQTLHEFANSACQWCPWTKAKYAMLRDRGMKHHAALRKLARTWIRILFRVWKDREPFDCERYIENLKQRAPEIIPYLEITKKSPEPLA